MKNPQFENLTTPTPLFQYDPINLPRERLEVERGKVRVLGHAGRAGILLEDVHGGILLGGHNLGDETGTISLWVMATEDLHPASQREHHSMNVPAAEEFTLLSDRESVKDNRTAHFAIVWSSFWTPSLYMKRCKGHVYEAFRKPISAVSTAGHFSFKKGSWYQLSYTWNKSANRHRIYANGILVAHNDAHAKTAMLVPEPGPYLCIGSTMFVNGAVCGYQEELSEDQCSTLFAQEAVVVDPTIQQELIKTYKGESFPKLVIDTEPQWQNQLELSLTDPDHLRKFKIQGCPNAPLIDSSGLRITTAPADPAHDFSIVDLNHVYLWSRDWFEGDLHISYSFQNLKRGGLSLLMTQCSGMQRDDFWLSHAPRTNGIMRPVCWEDIRNYHWEYLREMDDVRNDVASHAMLKNPWHRALGFAIHGPLYPLGQWNKLDFVQEGSRIRCAINSEVVIDVQDSADSNNGPVFSAGRFAIRCMTRTDIRIRDLTVRTRSHWHD